VADAVAQAQGKPEAAPAAPPEAPKAHDPYARAPQSWKPGVRETWNKLPAEVRAEVYRRETEVGRAMQESAQARQLAGYVQQLQNQYAPALQAEGVDALTASANLMGLVSRLRFGLPQERAKIIAGLVQAYGVDVQQLDAALVGAAPPPGQAPQQTFQDPRVDQLIGMMQQSAQQRIAMVRQQAVGEVEQFGQGREFFEDLREDMADIIEVAQRRGIDLSLDQAYERAVSLHPEISRIAAQRQAASQAQNPAGSTARAKLASSSIRSTPAVPPRVANQEANLRGAIEAAWSQAEENRR
jgi:hypothetical protein